MSQPQPSIPHRQNDPAIHAILRAMSVSHRRVRHFAAVRTALSVTIAAAGLVATFIDIATPITVIGALWAVIYSVGLVSWADVELRRAAVLQEMVDVELFGIAWNRLIAPDRIGSEEISRLTKRYRGRDDMIADYYEIPDDLRPPYDVLGCQQQNLGWGTRIRRRYAHAVLAGLIAWSAVGVVAGAVADLTVGELLLRWYVPSLGLLLLGVDVFRSQRDVAIERERVFRLVRETVTEAARRPQTPATDEELLRLARQIQDVLFLTRQRAPRVPDWFFLRFRTSDRADFQAVMAEWQATLARQPAPERA